MSPQRQAVVLVVIGVLLLTNPFWLFPHEGEVQYTYDRSEILVEDGTLSYSGASETEFAEENSLNAVGCQLRHGFTEQPRACAFDAYLVDHGPVADTRYYLHDIQPDFVRIGDAYYRRTHTRNETAEDVHVMHDVERVTPRTVLAESALLNISDYSRPVPDFDGWGDRGVEFRVAITGDAVTTFEDLGEDNLGNVYRQNDSYYTVVVTSERYADGGPDFLRYDGYRYLLMGVGLVPIAMVLSRRAEERD
ncbi:hypothetical protein [Haloarchaeobius sp. HRN-SO-5]|uniref:hypothetical protein n=1 Tax=Haloarchaeobius sp. HRN-SO-5 TaxID=3446118 RepID=UPI003EBF0CBA